MSALTAVVADVLRCTAHITDRDIRAKYVVEDLRLRGYEVAPPCDEPSPWNAEPCPICGGYLDQPHEHVAE